MLCALGKPILLSLCPNAAWFRTLMASTGCLQSLVLKFICLGIF